LEAAPQAFQLRILAEAKSIAEAALRADAQNRVTVLEREIGDGLDLRPACSDPGPALTVS
jgi:hypothetical protein